MKRLKKHIADEDTIYFVAMNPIDGVTHFGELRNGNEVETGLPVLYTSTDKDEVYNMVYDSWEMVEEEETTVEKIRISNVPDSMRASKNTKKRKLPVRKVCVGTPREFEFTSYTQDESADLDDILAEINTSADFKIVAVDKPDSTDRLLIFSDYSFSKLPGKTQDNLMARKIKGDGKRIKKEDL